MDRHMEQEINTAISQYTRTGVCKIEKWKMYEAYDAQRLNKNAWRDIKDRIIEKGNNIEDVRIIETESDFIFIDRTQSEPLEDKV
jgi:hypothetical protein